MFMQWYNIVFTDSLINQIMKKKWEWNKKGQNLTMYLNASLPTTSDWPVLISSSIPDHCEWISLITSEHLTEFTRFYTRFISSIISFFHFIARVCVRELVLVLQSRPSFRSEANYTVNYSLYLNILKYQCHFKTDDHWIMSNLKFY